ncbi:MAG TPA: hypothetical protein VJL58_00960 [Pyrinomonadaceae bacterium]|nr:hypothetical protein [Pyrinomonadaceae bacterium]
MFKLSKITFKQARNTQRRAFIAILGTIMLAAIAYASIPDANGIIHGCYKKAGGTLRVVDGGVQCASNELALNWNQTGPQGPPAPMEGPAGGALDGMYPNPGIADGAVTTTEIANGTIGIADLANGAVSAPKLLGGAAATNVWGNNQWAPSNATQRGFVHIRRNSVGRLWEESGGFESISFPVPLAPGDTLVSHTIRIGAPVPDGCSGSFAEPGAAPGNICIFYDPAYDAASVHDVTLGLDIKRFGRTLRVDQENNDSGCYCAIADVTWAMTPPIN